MASPFICPKGHNSADEDFCSECGAKIQGVVPATAAPAQSVPSAKVCPDCGAPAPAAGVNFCEICGFNFVTNTSGQFSVPVVPQPLPPPPPLPPDPPTPPAPPVAAPAAFKVTVSVDPSLRTAESPEAPGDLAPASYPLDKPANLLGRKSEARAVFPEIPLDSDSAVSHRHGLISVTPDGSLIYRDLSSSNGTRLNGTEVKPLVDTPLKAGDKLTLGHWTSIIVEAIS